MTEPLDVEGETLLCRLKKIAREREGTVLAIVIVLGLLAYRALPDSNVPLSAIAADASGARTFNLKALVGAGSAQRERDASLVLADGRIIGKAAEAPHNTFFTVPYGKVLSIHHSRGRDPMWRSPKGPAPVTRSSGGALGVFVDRQWISLETNTDARFIVLRVADDAVRKVLAALEERTGRKAEILPPQ
jgi:hypothetical protein